ncbi:hypothetical protein [Photobacterium andalusiense]|uniref:Uncharacterized protein n=1 Tax=Photobacterium andalusiense TaxID=2204296 RepID=A0A1Y6MGF9_9GAMM|nr:hypothetical protein [Photobacterium andalusiense]SMY34999.1 hypothetical protein PAND9192_01667 [Photobacterium andalusiense]
MIELRKKEQLDFNIEFFGKKILHYGVTCNRKNKHINNIILLTDICCEYQRNIPDIYIHKNHKLLILMFFLDNMNYLELLKDPKYCRYLDENYLNHIGKKETINSFSALSQQYITQLFNSTIGKSYLSLNNKLKNSIYAASSIWYHFHVNQNIPATNNIKIDVDLSNATNGIKYAESIIPLLFAMTNNYQLEKITLKK